MLFTATALTGAAALGLSSEQAVAVVLGLKQKKRIFIKAWPQMLITKSSKMCITRH